MSSRAVFLKYTSLTKWSTALEKQTVAHVVKKFPSMKKLLKYLLSFTKHGNEPYLDPL
jgi:hypothetical protein